MFAQNIFTQTNTHTLYHIIYTLVSTDLLCLKIFIIVTVINSKEPFTNTNKVNIINWFQKPWLFIDKATLVHNIKIYMYIYESCM